MHVFPARVLTPDAVWYPTTAEENAVANELYVDERHGRWRRTMMNATVTLAPQEVRAARNTERMWFVKGTVDGEPTAWVVEYARGCGCGSTSAQAPNADQLLLLAQAAE